MTTPTIHVWQVRQSQIRNDLPQLAQMMPDEDGEMMWALRFCLACMSPLSFAVFLPRLIPEKIEDPKSATICPSCPKPRHCDQIANTLLWQEDHEHLRKKTKKKERKCNENRRRLKETDKNKGEQGWKKGTYAITIDGKQSMSSFPLLFWRSITKRSQESITENQSSREKIHARNRERAFRPGQT